jgi:hypothetical protein
MEVSGEALEGVYEELWNLADEPGAVSTAALLMHEWQQVHPARQAVELTPSQSDALRRAVRRLSPAAGSIQGSPANLAVSSSRTCMFCSVLPHARSMRDRRAGRPALLGTRSAVTAARVVRAFVLTDGVDRFAGYSNGAPRTRVD